MKLARLAYILALLNFGVIAMIVFVTKKPAVVPSRLLPAEQVNTTTAITQKQNVKTGPISVKPAPDNRCLITIDGSRYDVTNFRSLHSGGDIFQCSTDMSAIFHNQHSDSFLRLMSKYKI